VVFQKQIDPVTRFERSWLRHLIIFTLYYRSTRTIRPWVVRKLKVRVKRLRDKRANYYQSRKSTSSMLFRGDSIQRELNEGNGSRIPRLIALHYCDYYNLPSFHSLSVGERCWHRIYGKSDHYFTRVRENVALRTFSLKAPEKNANAKYEYLFTPERNNYADWHKFSTSPPPSISKSICECQMFVYLVHYFWAPFPSTEFKRYFGGRENGWPLHEMYKIFITGIVSR